MAKVSEMMEAAQAAFERLNQREQLYVKAGAGLVAGVILLIIFLSMSSAVRRAEHRVLVKTQQLQQVIQLQGAYKLRQQEQEARLRSFGRSQVRLVSLVEEAARGAGISIGQLRPEDGEPSPEGIIESKVDLRAAEISADRLQEFLNRVEGGQGIVIVRRMRVTKPYRKDTADIDMTITTYKLKST